MQPWTNRQLEAEGSAFGLEGGGKRIEKLPQAERSSNEMILKRSALRQRGLLFFMREE
jgi:hypothetical protein